MPAYVPFGWQKDLYEAPQPVLLLWVGRRGGKGRAVLAKMFKTLDQASQLAFRMAGIDLTGSLVPPVHGWIVAPTFSQARQVWHELKEFMPAHFVRRTGRAGGRGTGWNEDDRTVWLDFRDQDGGWLDRPRPSAFLEVKSADNPDFLQTVGLDFLWITEAQDIPEAAWDKVQPALNSPGRMGVVCIEGIPPLSRAHWFSRLYNAAKRGDLPRHLYRAFSATTFDNPYLTEGQKQRIHAEKQVQLESWWRRHYMAEQPESAGGFFTHTERAAVSELYDIPRPSLSYVAGLDLGMTTDPTVLVIKERNTRRSVWGVEMLKTDWTVQRETVRSECERFEVEEVIVDSTGLGGLMAVDDLRALGIPIREFHFSIQQKRDLFTRYALALAKAQVSYPPEWIKLREQLDALTIVQLSETWAFRQLDNGHDDWMDAECLALTACEPAEEEYEGNGLVLPAILTVKPLRSDDSGARERDPLIMSMRQARREARRKAHEASISKGELVVVG